MIRDPARHARCTVAYSTQKIVGKTLAGLPCPKGQNTDFIRISTRTIVFFSKPYRFFFTRGKNTDFIKKIHTPGIVEVKAHEHLPPTILELHTILGVVSRN